MAKDTYTDIRVEKGVPIPTYRPGPARKYPWRELDIGDSFWVADPKGTFRAQVHVNAKRFGIKLATRKEDGGVRVWRIA